MEDDDLELVKDEDEDDEDNDFVDEIYEDDPDPVL
jgi:hypothetical protein